MVIRYLLPSVVAFALVCAGCVSLGHSDDERAMVRYSLEHDGVDREYFVYLPKIETKLAEQLPVLFFLHGYGGSATGTEAETTNGLNRYAQRYGYIAVYPQGTWFVAESNGEQSTVTSWNDLGGNQDTGPEGLLCSADAPKYPCPPECGDCGRCGWTSCHDDIGFIRRVAVDVAQRYSIKQSARFVAGFSNGSMMAQRLACELPNVFDAVALIGGRLERGYQCTSSSVMPLLQINGGRDDTVPYEGARPNSDFFYASAPSVAEDWAIANDCRQTAVPWINAATTRQGLECEARCAGSGRESINCLWPQGEHVWPGYPAGLGSNGYCVTEVQQGSMPTQSLCVAPNSSVDVWGSEMMFEFFESHRDRAVAP